MPSSRAASLAFNTALSEKVQIVNDTLHQVLARQQGIQEDLRQAIDYTLSGPGKRIRSALVL
jgi:geranylgeranyl pyrophosphate synthase